MSHRILRTLLPLAAPLAAALATALAGASGCADAPRGVTLEPLPSPTGAGAAEPNLAVTGDGRAVLSWIEPTTDSAYALRFSIRGGDAAWSAPREILRRATSS
jgi:hypothetical protein